MLKYISNIIIIILLPLNVIFDVLTNVVFLSGGAFSYVRALLLLVILAYVIVTNKQEKSLFIPFLLFIIYCSIQIPFSSDLVYSLSMTLKILIPLLTFFVGFSLVTSDNKLRLLNSSVLIVQLVLCLNFFISNYLGIGNDVYSKENPFLAGNINDNWNIISYSLIVTPLIFKYNKKKNNSYNQFVFIRITFTKHEENCNSSCNTRLNLLFIKNKIKNCIELEFRVFTNNIGSLSNNVE